MTGVADVTGLERLPRQSAEEPSDIAGGANEIVLEPHFGFSAITGLAQPIGADEFALRSFNAVAPTHLLFERVGLHFPASRL